jgi:hypothetical protein
MATPSTELDFDTIKADIIDYMKGDATFSDYNFEGSALNALINILAYNTHTNAFLASAGHAERFLDSAQRRSSVVSKAKELGYTPKSVACSTAFLSVTSLGGSGTLLLPRGTVFTSSNENGSYDFSVVEDYTSTLVAGDPNFASVKVVEGSRIQNSFVVEPAYNTRRIFTIPNKTIDTSTLKVYVKENSSSVNRVEYKLAENVYELNNTSMVYFIQESTDGFFQIYFGDDVAGKSVYNLNVIEVDYFISSSSNLPNDCTLFGFDGTIGNGTSVLVETVQVAFGGADRENITSIKSNAIKSNSAKERTVSVSDYELALVEKFNFIKSSSVWGGEDNVPPVYGKVFISLQPVGGYTISNAVKRDVITPVIRKSSVMSVIPEFIDPEYTFMSFNTKIKFNPSKSTYSQQIIESAVKTAVSNYIDSVSTFHSDYLESSLLANITGVDPGVVSAAISKRLSFKVAPLFATETTFSKSINNPIVAGSISSTTFNIEYNGQYYIVYINEIPDRRTTISTTNGVQTIDYLGLYTPTGELIKEIGTVNLSTGKFDIAFALSSYISNTRFVAVSFDVSVDDISTYRNQILAIDSTPADTSIGLVDSNIVTTEIYTK